MKVSFITALGTCLSLAATATAAVAASESRCNAKCRILPGDSSWPSTDAWANFNATVDGRLVASSPLGSPCHDPTYDEAACTALQKQWTLTQIHLESSSSVMQPQFANQSCDPFTPREWPCTLGNYVSYVVNVTSATDVAKTVTFARRSNIRVLVRNTGHDYLGRSTGAGALGIWTHHMRDVQILNWSDDVYTGPAVKAAAGVNGAILAQALNPHGLVVVGGECPSVGLAGGYIQGGGHSVLSTNFGMAADQALEYEVVTADGRIVTASPRQNSELYWALSGGGAGNYGVVTSVTIRAHHAGNVGGGKVEFAVSANTSVDAFHKAVAKFHDLLPGMVARRATINYMLTNQSLSIGTVTALNQTGEFVRDQVLSRFLAVLADLHIPYTSNYTTMSYHDHYDHYMGPLPYGSLPAEAGNFASRLIPRRVIENNNEALQPVLRNLTDAGLLGIAIAGNFAAPPYGLNNAVFPAWRDTLVHMQLASPWDPKSWDRMVEDQKRITNVLMPQLEAVTPGSGVYMNEADWHQPNWKQQFYGANYDKLLTIKKKWDPKGVFYALKAVGSDEWNVADDGRMCRA